MRDEVCRLQQELVGVERIVQVGKTQRACLGIVIGRCRQIGRTAEVTAEAQLDLDLVPSPVMSALVIRTL